MDPLSATASAFQLALFVKDLVQGIKRFIGETKTIPQSIREVYHEVCGLELALDGISEVFKNCNRPLLSVERNQHAIISRVLQSCRDSLQELHDGLPQLTENTGTLQKVWLNLEMSLKRERVQQLVHHINWTTNVLHLHMHTLSLSTIFHTRVSQEQMQSQVQKLKHTIHSIHPYTASRISSRDNLGIPRHIIPRIRPTTPPDEEWKGEESSLDVELQDWKNSTTSIIAAISQSSLLSDPLPTPPPSTSASVDELSISGSLYDPEPEYQDGMSFDIIEYQIKQNQAMVQEYINVRLYTRATHCQRRGIQLKKRLGDISDDSNNDLGLLEELMDMKERLADIILDFKILEEYPQARQVLQDLLDQEVARQSEEIRDKDRRCRIYHKLGYLMAEEGDGDFGQKFVSRALEGRKQMVPMSHASVRESAELLVTILKRKQSQDEARGLQEWIAAELCPSPLNSTMNNLDLANALRWCKEQGLDVDNPYFQFDICDPTSGISPIHLAIQSENLEVTRQMLSHMSDIEVADEKTKSTPLHFAASRQNKYICELLLNNNAKVHVRDDNGMTPLHRCQSSQGGVSVAKQILSRCPSLIDDYDRLGKTALYTACEKRNKKMVQFLLEQNAQANAPGPSKRTPLMMAVDNLTIDSAARSKRTAIVNLLLDYHADPWIQDGDGRTPLDAVRDMGLARDIVASRLRRIAPRRPSSLSTASRGS